MKYSEKNEKECFSKLQEAINTIIELESCKYELTTIEHVKKTFSKNINDLYELRRMIQNKIKE